MFKFVWQIGHRFIPVLGAAAICSAPLAGCTAVRVVTHHPTVDAANAPAGTYSPDPDHKSLVFSVEHLGFSRFVARFDRWDATLAFDGTDPTAARLEAVIDAASVSAPVQTLTEAVKSNDMLAVDEFPEIKFTSNSITLSGETNGIVSGTLTIHGHTAPVEMAVTFNGGARNPLTGIFTLGFAAVGKLNRREFGLSAWPIVVGNEVRFEIEAEFRFAPDVAAKGGD